MDSNFTNQLMLNDEVCLVCLEECNVIYLLCKSKGGCCLSCLIKLRGTVIGSENIKCFTCRDKICEPYLSNINKILDENSANNDSMDQQTRILFCDHNPLTISIFIAMAICSCTFFYIFSLLVIYRLYFYYQL